MKHETKIIHLPHRTDRRANAEALAALFPGGEIPAGAFSPGWEIMKDVRASRGAAVTHLRFAASAAGPVLLLEDDAAPDAAGFAAMRSLPEVPEDCGLLLLGGSCHAGPSPHPGYLEVVTPILGIHAALYHTPRLKAAGWFLNAWELVASENMGPHGFRVEELFIRALAGTGLKAYRPERMAFTTVTSMSERTGNTMLPCRVTPCNAPC